MVRLLLTNRALLKHWKGPIMCVCLTNHALDQFLGDLLDADVDGIVRCGTVYSVCNRAKNVCE